MGKVSSKSTGKQRAKAFVKAKPKLTKKTAKAFAEYLYSVPLLK